MRAEHFFAPVVAAAALCLPVRALLQTTSFGVAIARPDGNLIPFASFRDGAWEAAWPEAEASENPAAIGTTPAGQLPRVDDVASAWKRRGEAVPRTWFVRRLAPSGVVEARVTHTSIFESHCSAQLALASDLPRKPSQFERRIGVATSDPSVTVGVVDEVPAGDRAWTSISTLVVRQFERLEAERQRAEAPGAKRLVPAPPIRIRRLYRERGTTVSPMYFEAERTYETPRYPNDPSCPAVTVLTGWLMPAADGSVVLTSPTVYLTTCDEKEVRAAAGLAALHVGATLFWVLETHGYENVSYVVAKVDASGVEFVVDVDGGGC